ncbi:MAG: hypothetical protein EPO28_11475 [Saprospiraceae bacterium]|nr:MAG: hypothetical protein EPO28_11475 [Saprospiraceae bacterium]
MTKGATYAPGLVHILSAMETCPSYQYRFDKASGKSYLKQGTTKCLHYYFYFIDELLGLGYLRVPTYPPFSLQAYFNGHNWLVNKLDGQGLSCALEDNAFTHISDYTAAQKIAGALDVQQLHKKFDELALKFCPLTRPFRRLTTGALCKWNTPPTSSSKMTKASARSMKRCSA